MGTPVVFSLGDGCVVAAARSGRWLCVRRIRGGKTDAPAYRPAVASDNAGTTLVAYERHPKSENPDALIVIGFRLLNESRAR